MMKNSIITFLMIVTTSFSFSQDGKIISSSEVIIPDSIKQIRIKRLPEFKKILDSTKVSRIVYLSDGLKVEGFIAEPKRIGKYPCIIFCRGGAGAEYTPIDVFTLTFLSEFASKGYVVIASQYRGMPKCDGIDEFGGKDVNDVINCVPVLEQWQNADTNKIGMYGVSRGGMMIYRSLQTLTNIKAAVINSGAVDMYDISLRSDAPEWEPFFKEHIPGYPKNKKVEFDARSALYWPEKIYSKTPLLIMQGTADIQVDASSVIEFVNKMYVLKKPIKFILYEGGLHGLKAIREYKDQMWDWYNRFLKNNEPLPIINVKR